jgi:CheY-like chemotaxis protein/anti-sigma regulatory factor (Ser/Thr protein kinase)
VDAALKIFAAHGIQWFDTVLTDFQMPGLTGLDLIQWMQQQDVPLASILLTGAGDKQLVKDSLRAGVSDFLDKPINLPKLFPALTKAVESTHRLRHLNATESAVKDLGRTQRSLINSKPVIVPGGVATVELAFHPKLEAGGDFFCFFQPTPEQLVCLLTDVSGHDLQSAYVSAYFQGVVRGMMHANVPVPEIFRYFNHYLTDEVNRPGQFRLQNSKGPSSIAALTVILDFATNTISALPCGSPAPIYVQPDGRALTVGTSGGAPLGWFPEFEPTTFAQPFVSGGNILMWTDGLDELADGLGVHPLTALNSLALARQNGNESAFLANAQDDVLCANLRLPGSNGADQFIPMLLDEYHGAQADEIDRLADRWRHHLKFSISGLTGESEHDILLATREAVLNAMKHGCQLDPNKSLSVQISYQRGRRKVKVWVTDTGNGHHFDFAAHEQAAAEQMLESHRGLIFIKHLAQTVTFERNGSTVIMDFQL